MRPTTRILVLVLALLASTGPLFAQKVGPANGSLLLAGGGVRDQAILQRFIELAGGPQAPIVVIPPWPDE